MPRRATWTRCAQSERTDANRDAGERARFYGLMPASISHEGYSAKPMHSYWDDFWALKGYDDAAIGIADALGQATTHARELARQRDEFRARSRRVAARRDRAHGIDYLPGRGRARRLRPDLDDDRARARRRACERCRPSCVRAHIRALLARFRRAPRRPPATGTTTRPTSCAPSATFVRLGWRDRAHAAARLLHGRPPAGGVEPVGRSRRPRPARAALRRRHAARLGRVRLHPRRRSTSSPTSATTDQRARARRRRSRRAGSTGDGIAVKGLRHAVRTLSYSTAAATGSACSCRSRRARGCRRAASSSSGPGRAAAAAPRVSTASPRAVARQANCASANFPPESSIERSTHADRKPT